MSEILQLQNAILVRGHYTPEETAAFIVEQKTKPLVKSGIYNSKYAGVDESFRRSNQVRINSINPFIRKLATLVETTNDTFFKQSISSYCHENDFVEYDTSGKFERHSDILWPNTVMDHTKNPIRKITSIVLLNDEFTGGKLALWDKGERYSFPFSPGDVVMLPSYIQHKVDSIESGLRYTVVSWSYGEF